MEPENRLSGLIEESGAVAFGIVEARPVDDKEWEHFERWIAMGWHAGMTYMENYPEIRRDPRLLLPGARSLVSVAYNYRQPNPFKGLATYALGRDYHKVLRKRLRKVAGVMKVEFGGEWRICIDSAPVLERYWAWKAGVGKRSDFHGNIMVEGVGSMVFLAELVTTLELKPIHASFVRFSKNPEAVSSHNIPPDVCPTGALQPGGTIDARRCINYLTIEKRDEFTSEENIWRGNAIFGCDVCQLASPENRCDSPGVLPEFEPMPGLDEFLKGEAEGFEVSSSPLKRASRLYKKD